MEPNKQQVLFSNIVCLEKEIKEEKEKKKVTREEREQHRDV